MGNIKHITLLGYVQAIQGNVVIIHTVTNQTVKISLQSKELATMLYCKNIKVTIEVKELN